VRKRRAQVGVLRVCGGRGSFVWCEARAPMEEIGEAFDRHVRDRVEVGKRDPCTHLTHPAVGTLQELRSPRAYLEVAMPTVRGLRGVRTESLLQLLPILGLEAGLIWRQEGTERVVDQVQVQARALDAEAVCPVQQGVSHHQRQVQRRRGGRVDRHWAACGCPPSIQRQQASASRRNV
jgi:hypothetical protein